MRYHWKYSISFFNTCSISVYNIIDVKEVKPYLSLSCIIRTSTNIRLNTSETYIRL